MHVTHWEYSQKKKIFQAKLLSVYTRKKKYNFFYTPTKLKSQFFMNEKSFFFFLFFFFPFHDEAVSWIVKFVKQYDYPFPVWVLSRFQPKWSIVWFFFLPHIQLYIYPLCRLCLFILLHSGSFEVFGRLKGCVVGTMNFFWKF